MAKIVAVCTSKKKGTKKKDISHAFLEADYGIQGDAHATKGWHRQISLLDNSSIDKMRAKGLALSPGDFAENLTTEGLELMTLPVGTRLKTGRGVELEITQIGKECHHHCQIYRQVGMCVMPLEGVFARIVRGGEVKAGDTIEVVGA
ncbi:MOSC domain-containing protein [Dehalogenimonas sp. 4OHTPN]|uniref:MOSC domain-containing protein n=1 Tax=Dehalogenimonas sp. 4OHTPN TaxID=3166643 RepID=A0AAU8G941_9CHLR